MPKKHILRNLPLVTRLLVVLGAFLLFTPTVHYYQDYRQAQHLDQVLKLWEAYMPQEPEMGKFGSAPPVAPLVGMLVSARAETRHYHGQARLDAFAQRLHLTWPQIVTLSHRVTLTDKRPRPTTGDFYGGTHHGDRAGIEIMKAVVTLFYEMGKQGEQITDLARPLKFTAYSQVKLRSAKLPAVQELDLIFQFLDRWLVIDEERLIRGDLLALGDPAKKRILERLKVMKANPRPYLNGMGYTVIFDAAIALKLKEAVPYLEYFHSDPQGLSIIYTPMQPGYYLRRAAAGSDVH